MTHRDPAASNEELGARDDGVRPAARPGLGVVLHVFYPELLGDLVGRLEALEMPPALIVSTVSDVKPVLERMLAGSTLRHEIVAVENRGRDIWPFVQMLTRCDELGYELVLKLHTKRSRHRGDGDRWRSELLDTLLGPAVVARVRAAFTADPALGLVGPSAHHLSLTSYIGANLDNVIALGRRIGVESIDEDAAFFAGSMFYVRLAALAPLRAIRLEQSDFEPELGQVDGTLAHAIERCFPLAVESAGFTVRAIDRLGRIVTGHAPIRSGYPFARETSVPS